MTQPLQRPHVLINVAATLDGKIDTVARQGAAISSESDRRRVDELRAGVDAVMVGGRTLHGEDPRLLVRSADLRAQRVRNGLPENPAKVGITSNLAFKPHARFLSAGPARIIVFLPTDAGGGDEVDALRGQGVELYAVGQGRVDLLLALRILFLLDIQRVLVEGGGSLNFELLRLGFVDEVEMFVAPLVFGGATAPTLADGPGLPRDLAIQLVRTGVTSLDDGGVVLRYRVKQPEL